MAGQLAGTGYVLSTLAIKPRGEIRKSSLGLSQKVKAAPSRLALKPFSEPSWIGSIGERHISEALILLGKVLNDKLRIW